MVWQVNVCIWVRRLAFLHVGSCYSLNDNSGCLIFCCLFIVVFLVLSRFVVCIGNRSIWPKLTATAHNSTCFVKMSNLIFVSLRVFISPVSIPYEQNIQGQII